MPTLFSPPSPEYAAKPRSTVGQVAKPVEFCRIPRNMYWFRKSTAPVIVRAPGFGSAEAAVSCAHAGVLARIKVVHTAADSVSAFFLIRDIESIHSSAIQALGVVTGGTALGAAGCCDRV